MRAGATALLLALSLAAPGAAAADAEATPLPVDRSTILREQGAVYSVEGKQTIPKGISISCLRDVHIVGRGERPTLRVEGSLTVQGVGVREVIIEGVRIEPATEFGSVSLETVIFREGGGVLVPRSEPAHGDVQLRDVNFRQGAGLDLTISGGSVEFAKVTTNDPTRIVGARDDGKKVDLRVTIEDSDLDGLAVAGARDVTIRLTHLTGELLSFENCDALLFDGNKVNARRVEITHAAAGALKKTKWTKCDVYSDSILLRTPRKGGNAMDRVLFEQCWFEGETDEATLREKLVRDGEDEEESGAFARFFKISEKPNELAGAVDR